MTTSSNPATFEVNLESLNLPAAALDRIEPAIQKAVLSELASVDIAPAFTVTMSRPGEAGTAILPAESTRGIAIA